MKRKDFLKTMALLPLGATSMKLNSLKLITDHLEPTEKMPVLFLGHGNPMNAIMENTFTEGFKAIGKSISKPKAILCISAHWETKGTYVTAMQKPPTIHDFGGFPKALFDVNYPAPGSPELALETQKIITSTHIGLNHDWGLDHGCWSVVKHLYPDADIPIIQMSIDYTKPAEYHYQLAKELSVLRDKGILIIGSGNSVHNLQMAAWDKMMESGYAFDWATEANEMIKNFITEGNHQPLIDYKSQGKAFDLAIPSPEHYIPLLYTLALQGKNEKPTIYNDEIVAGSLNMMSVKFDKA